jgi:hypothetical protein
LLTSATNLRRDSHHEPLVHSGGTSVQPRGGTPPPPAPTVKKIIKDLFDVYAKKIKITQSSRIV